MDIEHINTVKQLYVTDMTKTTKLVTIYIQLINARRVSTKSINDTFYHVHFKRLQ